MCRVVGVCDSAWVSQLNAHCDMHPLADTTISYYAHTFGKSTQDVKMILIAFKGEEKYSTDHLGAALKIKKTFNMSYKLYCLFSRCFLQTLVPESHVKLITQVATYSF